MAIIYGLGNEGAKKIKTLFDNISVYTSGENKVGIQLKGIGEFYIPQEEHKTKPSYVSGLQYAYQYFKLIGKELDFDDLINLNSPKDPFYKGLDKIAKNSLTTLLNNQKLDVVYNGLSGKKYADNSDNQLTFLYECSKIFGNKSKEELMSIKNYFERSLVNGGFANKFVEMFPEYNSEDKKINLIFGKELFNAIKNDNFTTSVVQTEFDINNGYRGNEYIRALSSLDKYKLN